MSKAASFLMGILTLLYSSSNNHSNHYYIDSECCPSSNLSWGGGGFCCWCWSNWNPKSFYKSNLLVLSLFTMNSMIRSFGEWEKEGEQEIIFQMIKYCVYCVFFFISKCEQSWFGCYLLSLTTAPLAQGVILCYNKAKNDTIIG